VMIMLLTLISARFTYHHTYARQFLDERGVSRDRLFQICTYIRTFTVQSNTFRHHLHIVFFQTRIDTMITRFHPFIVCRVVENALITERLKMCGALLNLSSITEIHTTPWKRLNRISVRTLNFTIRSVSP